MRELPRKRGKESPRFGTHQKESTKELIRSKLKITSKGGNNSQAIHIKCVETGEFFATLGEAKLKYKIRNLNKKDILLGKKFGKFTFEIVPRSQL